ncbi:MAG: UDP-N-acetylglucosamine--N-acetylmuramyl-(pentapeptide) pyrophosphoryl-undecaprenol N-acetylglucosamine transferase [Candidatus Campbellbacteria bacterium]|nr:UDP-N-acetylglucosamine--N-acetylmuramyl-(pentapeptide) pyrophosphoryl-undecaprenol N-acetylglucosamine transferase [Candidatus Campbellbacteria bacterium]
MKIVFTGGGTGGHFYPLIAVAERVYDLSRKKQMLVPKMYYIGPSRYDPKVLYQNNIIYKYCPAGKIRRDKGFFSFIKNIFSIFPIGFGILKAFFLLYSIYPDIVFSKGGYVSFPVLVAARYLHIPVIIHESDSKAGRVTNWSAKFAKHIAISYPIIPKTLEKYQGKIAYTGSPIRTGVQKRSAEEGKKFFDIKDNVPVILVLGGSTGSETINNNIIESLPRLIKEFSIIHQTGRNNITEVKLLAEATVAANPKKYRYKAFAFFNPLELRSAAGAASLVITRGGSGTLFEIASWGLPSIIIPLPEDVSHDQTKNAYTYAHNTGATVIEQMNLHPNVLLSEIHRIIDDEERYKDLCKKAKAFSPQNSAEVMAEKILSILAKHE